MERFIERFRAKATKARQVQSRVKAIERMDDGRRATRATRARSGFEFGAAERSGRVALEVEDARLEVGGRTLLEDGDLWLERGEHVSLVGPNGAGKTTLIEAIAGNRELDGGRVRRGHNVNLGYLTQHSSELGSTGTALEAAQRATGLSPGKARALLGRFLFSGREAEKPLDGLSGGERRRLSLAILVASDANVLILDEPTNHLDLDAREALEDALMSFGGALLLVSHDRALLDAVGTRTVALEDGELRSYDGGWQEYLRAREERTHRAHQAPSAHPKRERPKPSGPSKNARRRLVELEREVERAEASLRKLEDELADPSRWGSPALTGESAERHAAAKRAVEEAYARWEEASAMNVAVRDLARSRSGRGTGRGAPARSRRRPASPGSGCPDPRRSASGPPAARTQRSTLPWPAL